MSALSQDLRWRIIKAWKKQGLTTQQLAELFGVGAATVTRLKKTSLVAAGAVLTGVRTS